MRARDIRLDAAIRFLPDEGKVLLHGDRLLIFRQEAMGSLRNLLHEHGGSELARALFAQFGYRCGFGDFGSLSTLFEWETEVDRLASGPVMHTWEGIVHVEATHIDFDRAAGRFRMKGIWRNSYEAEVHVARFGPSPLPVCHSLTGYASGWCTAFFGAPTLAVETACIARGDPTCAFEIRDTKAWGPEADPWRDALSATDLSLSRILEDKVASRTRELEAANAALVRAKERAEAATVAKGDFLAMMSHEIRTPIAAILGFVELLLDGRLDPGQKELAATIRQSGESLLTIINDILDLSKIEAGRLDVERKVYDPRACVVTATRLVDFAAKEKALSLEVDVAPGVPPRVFGDPARLRQILLNLLSNSIKFTSSGGVRVHVRWSGDGGGRLDVAVSDTGIGIAAGKRGLLFQPFTQLESSHSRRFGGTGLGLSISRGLARRLGGDLDVAESREGEGSTFALHVAAAPAPAAPASEPAVSTVEREPIRSPAGAGSLRILVVEDNPTLQRVTASMLAALGQTVDTTGDGVDALRRILTVAYDVVLMDLQMPEMDGLTATRALRAALGERSPFVVALTANAMSSDQEACRAAGMDDYLSKPTSLDALAGALERARPVVAERGRAPDGRDRRKVVTRGGDLPPIQLDVLERLRDQLGGDEVDHLVGLYLESSRLLVQEMRAGLRVRPTPDRAVLERRARSLRATSLTVGAEPLATLGEALELAVAAGSSETSALLGAVEAEHRRVCRAFAERRA